MTSETRWWWIRHPPVKSTEDKIYGQQDVLADLTGCIRQIKKLSHNLPSMSINVTSDLKRALSTSAALESAGTVFNITEKEPAFREQDFGNWSGLSWKEISEKENNTSLAEWLSPAYQRPPGGESFSDVITRVVPAIMRYNSAHIGRNIVATAHAGSIRAALAYALNLDPERALSFSIDTLSLTRLDYIASSSGEGVWRIFCVNHTFK